VLFGRIPKGQVHRRKVRLLGKVEKIEGKKTTERKANDVERLRQRRAKGRDRGVVR